MNYSVIIPAYNEADYLAQSLLALKTSMNSIIGMQGEVIVVDNNSQDRTALIAQMNGARVVFEEINQISRARNTGAKIAKGQYLIFLDADTLMNPALLNAALKNLQSGKCCGGGALIAFDSSLLPSAQKALDFWNWFSVKFKFAAGSFIYCLKTSYEDINGFPETVYAGEEIWFSKKLKAWGRKKKKSFNIITQYPVISSSRKLEWFSPVHLAVQFLIMIVFPFATRFRCLCTTWYVRPKKTNN